MTNPYLDALNELCVEETSLSLKQMLSVIEKLEELRILLGQEHLYTQRAIGLAKGTKKEDPLDCPFVLRAIKEMLTTNKESLVQSKNLIQWLNEELNK